MVTALPAGISAMAVMMSNPNSTKQNKQKQKLKLSTTIFLVHVDFLYQDDFSY
jgi:anaerobic selenocysteine-containing dehydrogenase